MFPSDLFVCSASEPLRSAPGQIRESRVGHVVGVGGLAVLRTTPPYGGAP